MLEEEDLYCILSAAADSIRFCFQDGMFRFGSFVNVGFAGHKRRIASCPTIFALKINN
jgi:hypothetical protein